MSSLRPSSDYLSNNELLRSSSTNLIDTKTFGNLYKRPDSYNYAPSYPSNLNNSNHLNRRKSLAKLNDFRKKVHEVIDLCTNQNTDAKTELSQMINEEKKIYDLLAENSSLLRRTVSHQSFPQNISNPHQNFSYNKNIFAEPQKPTETKTPYRPQKNEKVPESYYYIPSQSQVGPKQTNFPQLIPFPNVSNVSKHESMFYPPEFHQTEQIQQPIRSVHSAQNLQTLFLRLKNDRQIQLSSDALRFISEIQRKTFEEIQNLAKQNLNLMSKLNQEIKIANELKHKNAELQNILARQSSTQPQEQHDHSEGAVQNVKDIQSKITRLQEELQRTNEINYNLRLELSNRGSGIPGIEELLRQGESIRQQTLRLIKLKEGDGSSSIVKDLERRLASEHAEKEAVLNEVRMLRERLGGVSQITIHQPNQPNEISVIRSRSNHPVKSVAQYGDLIEEMKKITGF